MNNVQEDSKGLRKEFRCDSARKENGALGVPVGVMMRFGPPVDTHSQAADNDSLVIAIKLMSVVACSCLIYIYIYVHSLQNFNLKYLFHERQQISDHEHCL